MKNRNLFVFSMMFCLFCLTACSKSARTPDAAGDQSVQAAAQDTAGQEAAAQEQAAADSQDDNAAANASDTEQAVNGDTTADAAADTTGSAAKDPVQKSGRYKKKTVTLPDKEYAPVMTEKEKESVQIGALSPDHPYYQEVLGIDHACTDYIKEMTIYDEEIDDTFVVHISLPPDYDETAQYPFVIMTDGVWRLSDHPQLRPLMERGEIEDVILVSIGYPNDYDYETIRERDLVKDPYSFLHFIVDNLIPCLKEHYSLSDENTTFTGHSWGGYFAFFTLFHSDDIAPGVFENYYIGSPSFQAYTGTSFIKDHEKQYFERSQSLPANVYITVGGDENDQLKKATASFLEVMEGRGYDGLSVTYEVIDGYDHNTVFKPSIRNTLLRFYAKQ